MLKIVSLVALSLCCFSSQAQEKSNNPRCELSESQLKRVQNALKTGETKKWGRDLIEYQNILFADVDKFCFPDTGIAASSKAKKIVKKGAVSNNFDTITMPPNTEKLKKIQATLKDNQIAEIGPAKRLGKPIKKSRLSAKVKAWKAWYKAPPECTGELEMKMFVYCNKLEKSQKAAFEALWEKKNKKVD